MTAVTITYLGEPGGDERSDPLHWQHLEFQIGKPVLVDPDAATTNGERIFLEHVIKKTRNNTYFSVEDAPEETPARRKRGKEEEPDGLDPDDYPEIPKDWRDMHHTAMIALARRLGADVSSREEAENFLGGYTEEKPRA